MKNLTIAFLATASLFAVGACKKKGGGGAGEAAAKMSELKDQMCACKDKACADKVQESMTKWTTEMAGKADKNAKMDEASTKKMAELGLAYGECMTKAMMPAADPAGGGGGSAPAPTEGGGSAPAPTEGGGGGGGASTGIPECDEYKAAIDKLASCEAIPEATRKTMKDAFDQASGAWAALPAEGKAAAATGCKAGADAVKQAAAACK
ncbi:MAG: hypothetical protein ACKV2T_30655 [Kofleriaceae bacterium]